MINVMSEMLINTPYPVKDCMTHQQTMNWRYFVLRGFVWLHCFVPIPRFCIVSIVIHKTMEPQKPNMKWQFLEMASHKGCCHNHCVSYKDLFCCIFNFFTLKYV